MSQSKVEGDEREYVCMSVSEKVFKVSVFIYST